LNFRFKDRSLEELYTEGKGQQKFPSEVVIAFLRAIRRIEAALDERDLRAVKGQRLEKLQGQNALYSIRLNKGWRLILRLKKNEEEKTIIIIEINNHYGN